MSQLAAMALVFCGKMVADMAFIRGIHWLRWKLTNENANNPTFGRVVCKQEEEEEENPKRMQFLN